MAAPVTARLVVIALTLAPALALLALGGGEPPAGPALRAAAAGDVRLQSSREGAAVLTADALAPGGSAAGTITLTNATSGPLALSLAMTGLTDEPGEGGGVLSEQLALRLERLTSGGADVVWSGALADLPDLELGTLDAGAAGAFRLTATLPEHGPAVDDLFADAAVAMGFRWTGLGDGEAPEAERHPDGPAPPADEQPEGRDDPAPWTAPPGPDEDEGRAGRGPSVRLWLGGRGTQRLGRSIGLAALCRPGCALTASAKVRVGQRWRSLGRRALGALAAGDRPAAVRYALGAAQRATLRAALRSRSAVTVQIRVTAAAPGHDSATKVRSLRLRP